MDQVEEQLEKARKNLLDMSLRNKLLNFRELKRSTATIVDEVPSEIYEQLVLDESDMGFLPRVEHPHHDLEELPEEDAVEVRADGYQRCLLCEEPELFTDRAGLLDHLEADHEATLEGEEIEGHTVEELEHLWELPDVHGSRADRYEDDNLQTPHTEEDLQKRLYHIHNKAEALIEDAGYNALHLAIGHLEWTEADAHDEPNQAPLILLPVELDRESARSGFQVRWNGEEVAGNLSLRLKLQEQGFELPEFEAPTEASGIRDHLERVQKEVEEFDDWEVVPEVHLGFFDFTKFIMYQDLDPEGWGEEGPADHPLIRALLDPEESVPEPEPFPEEAIDDELSPTDVHHVMDADPSQIAAIEDVKRGRDLVIEGPPGTGKSQTIVNMIAELLAEDKSVLFVSQKVAALDVVKERLDRVGVGDFCLELHSHKAKKSEFLEELERLSKLGSYDPDIPWNTFRRLEQKQDELDAYAEALRTPFGELDRTPWDLYGTKEETRRGFEDGRLPRVDIDKPAAIEPGRYQEAISALEELRARYKVVQPVREHPWRGTHPGQVLPRDQEGIEDRLDETLEALEDLLGSKDQLQEACEIQEARSLAAIEEAIEAAELLRESEPVDAEVLESSTWNQAPQGVDEIVGRVRRLRELQDDVGERTEPEHVDATPAELLTPYRQLHDTWTRWFRPSWYRLRSRVGTLYGGDPPSDGAQVVSDLEDLIEMDELEDEVEADGERGRELFGSLWRGGRSDPDQLERFSEWAIEFRRKLLDDVLEEESIDLVTRGVDSVSLQDHIEAAQDGLGLSRDLLRRLFRRLDLDAKQRLGAPLEEVPLAELIETLEDLRDNIDRLDRWARFDEARAKVRETPASPLVDLVNDDALTPDQIEPCFEGNLADGLLHEAFQERDPLADFDAQLHEDRIESFQELDEKSLDLHQNRVLAKLVDRSPSFVREASESSQAGILQHEFQKERRHKPIRVLLQEAGQLVKKMKPCFMMSPLSVAKYLDPGTLEFDVVIFDEASQVRPEDALGTIIRGEQVVVLGDSKQLPPTSFFTQVVDHQEGEDPWAYNVADVESILGLCKQAFPAKRLKWHYRSRHESLIAVSNQEFYDNDLRIYPSPVQDADDLGLEFRHLEDTVYDRGGSGVNREEAKEVAQAALEHYRENPDKSLGIGTFSQAQQEAVREEVELLRKEIPEIDEYFSRDRDEHFFVKNLERIQGDERDVIFVSVGYGYDADGRFSHNFGPLNHTGGWRRLNVLVTRARERCVVFSNFTADALDLSKTNARGVRSLKTFLDYAQNRRLESTTGVGGDPESPLERSVLQFLRDQGYEVHPQVGSAGFRLDMAVPDPENPGRYVLGIECDGASYHSSPVARARDRLREHVLEDRGWRLHRVWSTDWYRNEARTKEQLLEAVEAAIEDGPRLAASPAAGDDGGGEASSSSEETAQAPSLEDLQEEDPGPSLEEFAEPYEKASDVPLARLSHHDALSTTRAVVEIVDQEAPIHEDLLQKRVREHSNVDRLGKKIRATIDEAIQKAHRDGEIDRQGDFLYRPDQDEIPVRTRDEAAADIEYVPDEEIDAAIREILEHQYTTPREDLVRQTRRLLGFRRTGERIEGRIGGRVERLLEEGELTENARGIDVA